MAELLVTGGAGFIGANFVHYWRRHHPQDGVTVLDALTYAGNPANLLSANSVDLIEGDICDTGLVAKLLAERNIVQIDCPVSGGVGGAEKGTLAVMVSGPKAEFELLKPALDVIGKVFFIGEKPGAAQTMKLANNFLSATAMVATSEAVVMGVKAGLDPAVMIDVINAGSGMNTASRDKFPRAVLPRSFDFGFATGLMVKDVRLALEEMKQLGCRWRSPTPSGGSGRP